MMPTPSWGTRNSAFRFVPWNYWGLWGGWSSATLKPLIGRTREINLADVR